MKTFIAKSEDIKTAFFSLRNRDRALIVGMLATMPASGLANASYRYWSGDQVPPFQFVSPMAFALSLLFIQKWPAGFFRPIRMAPFVLLTLGILSLTTHREDLRPTDYVFMPVWIASSLLALWPCLNWRAKVKSVLSKGE